MVALLYALILIPVVCWLTAFGYETWIALGRADSADYSLGVPYVHASWEITHTLLVYAFTIFIISHADALPLLDRTLFLPVCVFMVSLIVRGCLYLYLFYGDIKHPKMIWHNLFAISHIIMLVAIILGALGTFFTLRLYSFSPNTDNLVIVAIGFVLTSALCFLPIYTAYQHKD